MSRWLSRDLINNMPLRTIEAEIRSIEATPLHERTVADTERLADLREAMRRITGRTGRNCGAWRVF